MVFFSLSLSIASIHPSSFLSTRSAPSFTNCSLQLTASLCCSLAPLPFFFSFPLISHRVSFTDWIPTKRASPRRWPTDLQPSLLFLPSVFPLRPRQSRIRRHRLTRQTCFTHSQRADPAVIKLRLCPTAVISCSIWWWCREMGRGGGCF